LMVPKFSMIPFCWKFCGPEYPVMESKLAPRKLLRQKNRKAAWLQPSRKILRETREKIRKNLQPLLAVRVAAPVLMMRKKVAVERNRILLSDRFHRMDENRGDSSA
uniref:THAP-type domain-containing protein n=1 Tax=Gongylonema pulchrum TaxID=637853 RepID=A0A183EPM8_9BILA